MMSARSVLAVALLALPNVVWAQVRQPIALAVDGPANQVLVANRGSGSVSTVDLETRQRVSEQVVGKKLSSIAVIPGTSRFLVTDEAAHELILMEKGEVLKRLPVREFPVMVRVTKDGRLAVVASLWSRCVSIVTIDGSELSVEEVLPLSFSPRELLLLEQDRVLVVADAFGGKVELLSQMVPTVNLSASLPAHNIRGLAFHPEEEVVIVGHQRLHSVAHTTIGDIHWGNLLGNHLRFLNLKSVQLMSTSLTRDGWLQDLGGPSNGAGDPGAMAVTRSGKVIVCLSGAHKVEIVQTGAAESVSIPVGRGPSDVWVVPETNVAVVANRFSDSLTFVDTAAGVALETVLLGIDPPEPSDVQRGEALFHDATLSLDGWMSCHSCHTDGHSSGALADTLSDGHHGTPKRILSLRGVVDTEPLGWRGNVDTLEEQIRSSVTKTMRGRRMLSEEEVSDLAAYLRALPPIPLARKIHPEVIGTGAKVFERLECANCHQPPLYTSPKTYDVGLMDELGEDSFNPPSLRGVGLRSPLLHDNSVESLEDLFLRRQHQLPEPLFPDDQAALLAFLRSL